MTSYTATEVAHRIGVEPRALRRWLRNNPSYNNAGAGGRYAFTDAEIASLEKLLAKTKVAKPSAPAETRIPHERPRSDDAMAVLIPAMTPALRRQVRDAERRLMEQVAACGLSVGRSGRPVRELEDADA